MKGLRLIHDYKHNDHYRLSFVELAKATFGIDFEAYYRAGFWNDRYICYSLLDGDQVVSNVSVSTIDLIWKGQIKKAVQIGTVMTHPDYRRKGLAGFLMNTVLREYGPNSQLIYLFPNEEALSFYQQWGFARCRDSLFSCTMTPRATDHGSLRRLDITDAKDKGFLQELAAACLPVSEIMGFSGAEHVLLFHCLTSFRQHIYYLEPGIVVIFKAEGETLHVYDIISRTPVEAQQVLPLISTEKPGRLCSILPRASLIYR